MADKPTLDWQHENNTPLFWQTDLDLERAQVIALSQRFVHASSLEQPVAAPIADRHSPTAKVARPYLVVWLAVIATVCVLLIMRWPQSAIAILVASGALAVGIVISAIAQISQTLAQQRENRALREALKQSQHTQRQLRFEDICDASRPAA